MRRDGINIAYVSHRRSGFNTLEQQQLLLFQLMQKGKILPGNHGSTSLWNDCTNAVMSADTLRATNLQQLIGEKIATAFGKIIARCKAPLLIRLTCLRAPGSDRATGSWVQTYPEGHGRA